LLSVFVIHFGCINNNENSSVYTEKQKTEDTDKLPYYSEATFTPQWLKSNDPILDTFHTVAPFSLTNQDGQTVTNETFDNKIYVVDFFFTVCPGICPRMMDNMGGLQDEFSDDEGVSFLSHSVTPEYDSVPILKAYAEERGVISGKWHLVTGERDEIYTLGRKSYFVEEDLGVKREVDEFLHTENFVLIDQNRHIRGIYNGLNKASLKHLIDDVNFLLMEDK